MPKPTDRTKGTKADDGWDPYQPGIIVRLRDKPGRQGTTTGNCQEAGSFLLTEIDFGPNDKQFKRVDLVEPVETDETMFDFLASGRFGGPIDLRAVLTFEKIKGDLTNVFYSMESSNTDFYAHQFKPVLKFIESSAGRLLIADEVGLGKTIEAIYIWKELQARQDARKLLIVCPAMLREKWAGDLLTKFNIEAEIVNAKGVFEKANSFASRGLNDSFILITSLQGLRPPRNYEDEDKTSYRARFARLLNEHTASEEFALFDLVVIDEAHDLRTSTTLSNRLGHLLREASQHMALLTATPMHIGSDNLYQLMRLVDPDQFYDARQFDEILRANGPVVNALRCVWRQPPDLETAAENLDRALESAYFEDDTVLSRVREHISNSSTIDAPKRVEFGRLLESRSLLGQFMTRSRKREVLPDRVERTSQVLSVTFAEPERELYDRVTENIRIRATATSGIAVFALIARQRQMASSLVAALEGWNDKGLLEEMVWEDLGRSPDLQAPPSVDDSENGEASETTPVDSLNGILGELPPEVGLGPNGLKGTLAKLEELDGKYNALRAFLTGQLRNKPKEKFVVFAFYRKTLSYLHRRLTADGINSALIMGGMGDEAGSVLENFSSDDGPNVLLSSEVGSEGIDLQFCRFLVNYDLPWNPMKVEQRIGRIDRLGQKAKRISIVNLVVENTIEDRILMRLYERIELFQSSIGGLEEILGKMTERLMVELFDPDLTDEDRERRARETEMAIVNERAEQERLEQEAVNLVGFSDYILENINDSREKGRWLSPQELLSFVEDFFVRQYPGTKIEAREKYPSEARILLSKEARIALGIFVKEMKPGTRTRLHQSTKPVACIFDPRQIDRLKRGIELIDPTHPLIQWIREQYRNEDRRAHPVSAIRISASDTDRGPGLYVFATHRWSFVGLRAEHRLAYQAMWLDRDEVLDSLASESLVVTASRSGEIIPNAMSNVGDLDTTVESVIRCDELLRDAFAVRMVDFEAENEVRCNQQETSARRFAERKLTERREILQRQREKGNIKGITLHENLLRHEEERLQAKLTLIAQRRDNVDPTMVPLASGVIRVE